MTYQPTTANSKCQQESLRQPLVSWGPGGDFVRHLAVNARGTFVVIEAQRVIASIDESMNWIDQLTAWMGLGRGSGPDVVDHTVQEELVATPRPPRMTARHALAIARESRIAKRLARTPSPVYIYRRTSLTTECATT